MVDTCDEITSLESRHRKEKKELQAQIQALKKTAKNDKTKKKELTAEIARLETEQEIRHKQELQDLEATPKGSAPDNLDDEIEKLDNEVPKLKISKAQKRRDKKQQQEKDREEQIKIQEKENVNGPRNVEVQAITEKLKKKNLKLFPIPSDGDCLYKAVAHQLDINRHQTHTVDELRKNVAMYIRSHKDDFIPFMSHPDTSEMLDDGQFEEYCDKITGTKVWGGQLEIRALSNSLKCPISVIQATGPDSIEQGMEFDGPPLIITYHRHMYSLGEHYNSTCAKVDGEEN
ncbi:deubiquitinase OTUD6B [Pectinophora gossypiella]|uniref:deubiquitinase OTUD6B n=1 Tax=Pectinophora gossypiella TaxID=13191 RepID=UPI00214F0E2B|nr:deubiquitinase OTUD6B [Pectinophora gossypiella]